MVLEKVSRTVNSINNLQNPSHLLKCKVLIKVNSFPDNVVAALVNLTAGEVINLKIKNITITHHEMKHKIAFKRFQYWRSNYNVRCFGGKEARKIEKEVSSTNVTRK
jgi:hypothetical protein